MGAPSKGVFFEPFFELVRFCCDARDFCRLVDESAVARALSSLPFVARELPPARRARDRLLALPELPELPEPPEPSVFDRRSLELWVFRFVVFFEVTPESPITASRPADSGQPRSR